MTNTVTTTHDEATTYETTASVLHAPDAAMTRDSVTLGPLRGDEVLIDIHASGFCHTDLVPRYPAVGERMVPIILGHEGAGVVRAVGDAVTTIRPGDHVLLSFDSCGSCERCQAGDPAYCPHFRDVNLTGRRLDGSASAVDTAGTPVANRWFGQSSFADACVATERNVVVVDADLPLEILAPLGCGLQTGAGTVFTEMKLAPGQSIAVFGVGAVGLAAVMAARIAGASEIIAVDLHQSRIDLAIELGASRGIKGDAEDLVAQLRANGGVNFVLDTTGAAAVIRSGIAGLAPHGKAFLVGVGAAPLTIHPSELTGVSVGYVLEGSSNPHQLVPELVEHWKAGRFPVERLIEHYHFDDIASAEADMLSGRVVKPVLVRR